MIKTEKLSVVDNSKKQSTMEYKNSDLTKNIDAKGYAYEYTYDDNHNVTKIESQTHMNYNYTYSTKGLATSLEVKCDPKVTDVGILKSEVTYDSNGLSISMTVTKVPSRRQQISLTAKILL